MLKNYKIRSIREMGDSILNCALFECIRDRSEKQTLAEKISLKKSAVVMATC